MGSCVYPDQKSDLPRRTNLPWIFKRSSSLLFLRNELLNHLLSWKVAPDNKLSNDTLFIAIYFILREIYLKILGGNRVILDLPYICIYRVSHSTSANIRKQVEYSKLNRKVLYHFTTFAIIIEIFNIKVRQIRARRDTMGQALEPLEL